MTRGLSTTGIAVMVALVAGGVGRIAADSKAGGSADLIAGARLYVGIDTGTSHIAAATGTPVEALSIEGLGDLKVIERASRAAAASPCGGSADTCRRRLKSAAVVTRLVSG